MKFNFLNTAIFASFIAVPLIAASEIPAWLNFEESSLPEVTSTVEKIQLIEVVEQTSYTDGAIAYVDYSTDPLGECIVVWYPEARFSHCDDAPNGWQTLFHRKVPAGTGYSEISIDWNEIYAPGNWS